MKGLHLTAQLYLLEFDCCEMLLEAIIDAVPLSSLRNKPYLHRADTHTNTHAPQKKLTTLAVE